MTNGLNAWVIVLSGELSMTSVGMAPERGRAARRLNLTTARGQPGREHGDRRDDYQPSTA